MLFITCANYVLYVRVCVLGKIKKFSFDLITEYELYVVDMKFVHCLLFNQQVPYLTEIHLGGHSLVL